MKRFLLLLALLVFLPAQVFAATATVTCVPPTQFTDNSTLAWAQITAFELVDQSKPVPGDIGTVIATFTPPATAPAAGASITLTATVTPNNPPTADNYVLRVRTANGPGQASTVISATIPLALAKAPATWTLTFVP